MTIARTALRYRNPLNAPDDCDRKVLEAWEALQARGEKLPDHELISTDDEVVRFYKPIMLLPVCINCHGSDEQLIPELKTELDELYPGDQARDFRVGDLRGAFRVELKIDSIE